MTPERFAVLAGAYGADPDRWPEAEREQALAFQRARPDQAQAVLEREAALDAALACWTVSGPGADLSGRVMAGLSRGRSLRLRWRVFLSGLGAAVTLAGGVAAGISVLALPQAGDQVSGALYSLTVLGEPIDDADEVAPDGQTR